MDWEQRVRRNTTIMSKGIRRKVVLEVRKENDMIREIKFNVTPERNLFVFSDPHFFHNQPFIYAKRGFKSVQEHAEALINKINETVRPDDWLVCCGDWSLNATREGVEDTFDRIKCQNVFYIWGNHNNPMLKIYREQLQKELPTMDAAKVELYPVQYKNIIFVGSYMEMFVNGKQVIFCHYPISEHNNLNRGSYMLCGHSHGGNPATHTDATDGLILDMGWDLHGKPLSFAEIEAIMSKKNVRKIGHH